MVPFDSGETLLVWLQEKKTALFCYSSALNLGSTAFKSLKNHLFGAFLTTSTYVGMVRSPMGSTAEELETSSYECSKPHG